MCVYEFRSIDAAYGVILVTEFSSKIFFGEIPIHVFTMQAVECLFC